MNIVLLSSISNNPAKPSVLFLIFDVYFRTEKSKSMPFQNEVMHSSRTISLSDFHFQIKIEEQNLFLQQKNSLCAFFSDRRG